MMDQNLIRCVKNAMENVLDSICSEIVYVLTEKKPTYLDSEIKFQYHLAEKLRNELNKSCENRKLLVLTEVPLDLEIPLDGEKKKRTGHYNKFDLVVFEKDINKVSKDKNKNLEKYFSLTYKYPAGYTTIWPGESEKAIPLIEEAITKTEPVLALELKVYGGPGQFRKLINDVKKLRLIKFKETLRYAVLIGIDGNNNSCKEKICSDIVKELSAYKDEIEIFHLTSTDKHFPNESCIKQDSI